MGTATWDKNRGRRALNPTQIGKQGWKDIFFRVKNDITENHIGMAAAAMSYYALFAIVPALSSLVMIYAWFSDPVEISGQLKSLSEFIPAQTITLMETTLTSLASKASSSLGIGAIVALLISLWSASNACKSLIEALNVIYGEKESRHFLHYTALALGLTFFAIIMCILALGVVVGVPAVMSFVNLGPATQVAATIVSWTILLSLFTLYLSVAYRYSPSRKQAKWRWVSWGAVIASILWAITSGLFSWYVKEFADFDKTYGSFGAIIVLMTWFFLSSYVILLGAEINAELEHQTMKDSTNDPERPMGYRGAKMADTIGPSSDVIKRRTS